MRSGQGAQNARQPRVWGVVLAQCPNDWACEAATHLRARAPSQAPRTHDQCQQIWQGVPEGRRTVAPVYYVCNRDSEQHSMQTRTRTQQRQHPKGQGRGGQGGEGPQGRERKAAGPAQKGPRKGAGGKPHTTTKQQQTSTLSYCADLVPGDPQRGQSS